jgi:hypothetical protein
MKKILLLLSIHLLTLPGFTGVQAQALSSSPTLSFSHGTGFWDNIAQDGEGGSVAISDINIQVMPINSSGAKLTADPLDFHGAEWFMPPIITYGDMNSLFGWSIKSDNGADFSLVSFDFHDWGEWSGDFFSVQAFHNGASLGSVSFRGNTDNVMIHLTNTGVLTSLFQRVDEVRIYRLGGAESWTGLNNIKVSSPSATLPVTWLSFMASRQARGVALNWSTALEQNTKDYVVQHSSDGRNWSTLAIIAAAGNSNTVRQYSYLHNSSQSSAHYYRVLQRDTDGRESFSKVVAVNQSGVQPSFSVYPNPVVNGQLTVVLEKEARIELFNPAGVLVFQQHLTSGSHPLQLPTLGKGLYTIRAAAQTITVVVH